MRDAKTPIMLQMSEECDMTDLRYPIGPFKDHAKDHTTADEKAALMDGIEAAPARLRAAAAEVQLRWCVASAHERLARSRLGREA